MNTVKKFRNYMRTLKRDTGFEGYLGNIQSLDPTGAPTREEARKDYLAEQRLHNHSAFGR